MSTLQEGASVSQVIWHRYDDNGSVIGESKSHYTEDGSGTTICGTKLPHWSDCEGTGDYVNCKRCQKIFESKKLTEDA